MKLKCENCQAAYNVDENAIRPDGSKVRCLKCRYVFTIYPPSAPKQETPSADASDQLLQAIRSSQGQFSLILAICNYAGLRKQILKNLKKTSPFNLWEIDLSDALFNDSLIQAQLKKERPDVAMIFGADFPGMGAHVLSEMGQISKSIPFPIILWISDESLREVESLSPDFASSIRFDATDEELLSALTQNADNLFLSIAESEKADPFVSLRVLRGHHEKADDILPIADLSEPDAFQFFLADLKTRKLELDAGLNADLQFLRGRHAQSAKDADLAIACYTESLDFLKQGKASDSRDIFTPKGTDSSIRQGILLNRIAKCHFQKKETEQAKLYCLSAISALGHHQRLTAKFTCDLCHVLQELGNWEELESISGKLMAMNPEDFNEAECAAGQSFLAGIALHRGDWEKAEKLSQNAMASLSLLARNNARLILAKAWQSVSQPQKTIEYLEAAALENIPQSDPELHFHILKLLHTLYSEQDKYFRAFQVRQEKKALAYAHAYRAFAGARPLSQASGSYRRQMRIAPEIRASQRYADLGRLMRKICGTDAKLMLVHGHPGVGKTSFLEAGFIPAFRQIGIPLGIRTYADWLGNIGAEMSLPEAERNADVILHELRKNDEQDIPTVLIFDQFETFFSTHTGPEARLRFYGFMQSCLCIPSLKMILSLRDDALHHLLECDQVVNSGDIHADMLARDIRHAIGNLSLKDARAVIRAATRRSHFILEDALVNKIVHDLKTISGEIIPLELQVLGSQLESKDIRTLEAYESKEKQLEGFLRQVISDCEKKHPDAVQVILYHLTGEENSSVRKTRSELIYALKNSAITLKDDELRLILKILVGTGLLFLMPGKPGPVYQIAHKGLLKTIRQGHAPSLLAELEIRKREQHAETERQDQAAEKLEELAEKVREIETLTTSSCERFLAHDQLGALFAGIKAVKALQDTEVPAKLRNQLALHFRGIVEGIQEKNRLEAHHFAVRSLCFSPDGKLLASGSDDSTVRLWSTQGGSELETLEGHSGPVLSADFSPDGQWLASGSEDRTIRLWQIRHGRGEVFRTLKGHSAAVCAVRFSPDGKMLASGGEDRIIRFWNVKKGRKIRKVLKDHADTVLSLDFHSQGKRLASGSSDSTIRLWDWERRKEIGQLAGHSGAVCAVRFSPDGNRLVSGSEDRTLGLWQVEDSSKIRTLQGHSGPVSGVDFSPDGKLLVSGSSDKTLRMWDADTGHEVSRLEGHDGHVPAVRISPGGETMASGSGDNTIRLWDVENSLRRNVFRGHSFFISSLAFSPDGKLLASGSFDQDIRLISPENCAELTSLKGHSDYVSDVCFSPDGETLASAGFDHTIRLWQTRDGAESGMLEGHQGAVHSIAFSPDGKLLASGGDDSTIRLWQIREEREAKLIRGHGGSVLSVSISSNGRLLASGGEDRSVRLWNLADGKAIRIMRSHYSPVYSVSLSPDSRMIASAGEDDAIRLWDVEDGTEPRVLTGHSGPVRSIRFSPDGQFLVSAGFDNTVRLWRVADGAEVNTLTFHSDYVLAADFSPDGKMLASGGTDSLVRVWDISETSDEDMEHLMVRGCHWLESHLRHNPNMSWEDRRLCEDVLSEE
ncbi:MAG: hypothetical protein B6245_18975 [Desulfobacteraceae bacterium 4572_88]|nr:MAG: hypothetical protein B6245_18975 [Desulfobacteraceae bacterium 4572_88]